MPSWNATQKKAMCFEHRKKTTWGSTAFVTLGKNRDGYKKKFPLKSNLNVSPQQKKGSSPPMKIFGNKTNKQTKDKAFEKLRFVFPIKIFILDHEHLEFVFFS